MKTAEKEPEKHWRGSKWIGVGSVWNGGRNVLAVKHRFVRHAVIKKVNKRRKRNDQRMVAVARINIGGDLRGHDDGRVYCWGRTIVRRNQNEDWS